MEIVLTFFKNNAGLLVNMLGSIFVVISIGKFPKGFGGSTTDDDGNEYHFAYVTRPSLLKWGLILMIIGFFLQINWEI